MGRKQELKQQYKEAQIEAGVFQIRNTKNQKVLVLSTANLKTINGRRFELQSGGFTNRDLQKEWQEFGEESFVFEVLEVLKGKDDPARDLKLMLAELEETWLNKLEPYGDRGYNRRK